MVLRVSSGPVNSCGNYGERPVLMLATSLG